MTETMQAIFNLLKLLYKNSAIYVMMLNAKLYSKVCQSIRLRLYEAIKKSNIITIKYFLVYNFIKLALRPLQIRGYMM